jgi:hypothetical protein
MMTFSKTDKSLTIMTKVEGKNVVLTTTSTNTNWAAILDALKQEDETKVVELMSVKAAVEAYTESNIVVKDGNVFFKTRQLHGLDVTRQLEFKNQGIPFLPMARFLERKMLNPSSRAINELYTFLEHKKMPITPEGKIRGYKGVQADYWSCTGNKETVVLKGKVNEEGKIYNGIGEEIEMLRNSVCDDYQQGCAMGLHIGSLEYASTFGGKMLIVEFDPADVVSVPSDCNCQKLRVCKYKVIGEYEKPLNDTYVNDNKQEVDEVVDDSEVQIEQDDDAEEIDDMPDPLYVPDNNSDESTVAEIKKSSYGEGYTTGLKDGKAHDARQYYITDEENAEIINEADKQFVKGYNAGYRMGRYNE